MSEKNYKGTVEISEKMIAGMETCLDLIGERDTSKQNKYGFIPGMNMNTQARAIGTQLSAIKEGVFSVMFTGMFNSGKSTAINAMLKRNLLKMANKAETAIVTKLVFNKQEEVVKVIKKEVNTDGSPKIETMSIPNFFAEYSVDEEDETKFIKEVDCAIIDLKENGIANGMVQIVDSPGTQSSESETKMALEFLNNANAVVFMITATAPFTEDDKLYIAEKYEGRYPENVFFLVNRYNQLNDDEQEEIKTTTRKRLKKVFTDSNGCFDEKLYNDRVYFVDAQGELYLHLGKKRTIMGHQFDIDPNSPGIKGMRDFESSLERFLTDNGRDKAAFRAFIPQLLNTYKLTCEQYEKNIELSSRQIEELLADKKKLDDSKEQMEALYSQIENACKTCVQNIRSDISNIYDRTVNRIDFGWDSYLTAHPVKLNAGQVIGLITTTMTKSFRSEEEQVAKIKNSTKSIQDAIKEYIEPETEKMNTELEAAMNERLKSLSEQLDLLSKQMKTLDISISYEEIMEQLLSALPNDTSVGDPTIDGSFFQILIGLIALDPDTILIGIHGNTSNGKVIVETLVKNIVEFVALYVVAWPIGLAMLALRLIKMVKDGRNAVNSTSDQIIKSMRVGTVDAMRDKKGEILVESEKGLRAITRAGNTMTEYIRSIIDDYNMRLDESIENIQSGKEENNLEAVRMDKIKEKLFETINGLNIMLNGKELNKAEIGK